MAPPLAMTINSNIKMWGRLQTWFPNDPGRPDLNADSRVYRLVLEVSEVLERVNALVTAL